MQFFVLIISEWIIKYGQNENMRIRKVQLYV